VRFYERKLLNIKCVLWFSLQNFVILRRIELDVTKNVYWCACEVPVVLVRF